MKAKFLQALVEAGIGLAVACLVAWCVVAGSTEVPFVYQGF